MRNRICTCQKPQLFSYYCSNMLAACQHLRSDPQQYVSKWYSLMTNMHTWDPSLRPIPDPAYWIPYTGLFLLSDLGWNGPRMEDLPQSTCLYNEMNVREGRGPLKCGKCRETGHNRRQCPRTTQWVCPDVRYVIYDFENSILKFCEIVLHVNRITWYMLSKNFYMFHHLLPHSWVA